MGNFTFSVLYADANITGGMALTSMAGSIQVFALLILPALLLIGFWWRGSVLFGIPAMIATLLIVPELKPYGGFYTIPLLIVAIATAMKILYDILHSGVRV